MRGEDYSSANLSRAKKKIPRLERLFNVRIELKTS